MGADRRRAYREMTIAGVIWGTTGPAAALVAERTSLTPLQTSFWRLAVAILPLTLLAVAMSRGARPRARHVLVFGLGVGVVTGVSQLSYFAAVASAGIAIPTLIAVGLGPVFTAIGQTVIFGVRPSRRTLLALGGGLTGLGLLVLDVPGTVTAAGVLLALLAAITFAIYTLAAGPATRRMDVTVLNAAAIAGGTLTVLPFVLATGGPGVAGSAVGWLAILHLGLMVSGLAYWLYFSAARSLPSTHLTIIMLLEPLVATLIAAAAFGESITAGVIAGGALMLGAVVALRPPRAVAEVEHGAAR
jgi:DME family drug/metabolite transporter